MTIIGYCPECNSEESIVFQEDKAVCMACHMKWEDWREPFFIAKEKGIPLTPVVITQKPEFIQLKWPQKHDVVFGSLIIEVLNAAAVKYWSGLRIIEPSEEYPPGSSLVVLRGEVDGEIIELHNCSDTIGLIDTLYIARNPICRTIILWYAEILELLFEKELVVNRKSFGRGGILKLSGHREEDGEQVKQLLWLVLYKLTRSKKFAMGVFKQLDMNIKPPTVFFDVALV